MSLLPIEISVTDIEFGTKLCIYINFKYWEVFTHLWSNICSIRTYTMQDEESPRQNFP